MKLIRSFLLHFETAVLQFFSECKGEAMHKRIVFKNMEHSSVMEEYANQQLEKVIDFLKTEHSPIYIDLTFEPSKTREHHRIELRIKTPRYEEITHYEHKGMPFYEALDRVIDTMYLQLHEQKRREKKDEHKVRGRHDEFKKQR